MSNTLPTLLNDPLSPLRKLTDQTKGNAAPQPLRGTKNASPNSPESPPATTSTASPMPDFRELLAVMMMGMTMQGGSGEDSSGFSMSSMMAPIMMSLMEQLMSQEVTETTTEESQTIADQTVPNGLPVEGRFTQDFHTGHTGVDIAIVTGTPVQSSMDGEVVYAGWNNQGYGNLVIVENGPYRTYYAHLSEIPVEMGQAVRAGDIIGLSGNTGNSTGPHLHYEVRYNGQPLNPSEFY